VEKHFGGVFARPARSEFRTKKRKEEGNNGHTIIHSFLGAMRHPALGLTAAAS